MVPLDFNHESELTIEILIRRIESFYPEADFDLVRKAYEIARTAHEGQNRSSGEEYIIHPLNVTSILIKLKMDINTILSGLLHDVIEDSEITAEDLELKINPQVAEIVIGLTKISKIKFKSTEENQAENFRKMLVAMAKDLRVIIVKLADRMHNMRTLQYISLEKQKRVAQETLDIYVPLASRLGINSVKSELEDLCLRYLQPDVYYKIAEKVAMKKIEREKYIRDVVGIIQEKLLEYGVEGEVKGRPKHFYSIYKKMHQRNVDFEQIQDILAFRIIVSNITECYKSLGIIHSSFTPIPGRFKDYIAIPKVNNYQSLHTTVIGPKAERIEIQIRTHEMNDVAETGVAATWQYKEGVGPSTKSSKLDWVEELLEYNQTLKNHHEFLDIVKNDLDIGGVFVFTPNGDVIELRPGSTPLDFAYAVHTEVGNFCVGCKINGKIVPLKYRLKSGDVVEILTSKTQRPSKDWLKIARTSKAKSKIRQWLIKAEREKDKEVGQDYLDKALRVYNLSILKIKKSNEINDIIKNLKLKGEEDLFVAIGSRKISIKDVLIQIPQIQISPEQNNELNAEDQLHNKTQSEAKRITKSDNSVIVDGMDDVQVRFAKCCNPIPGDIIVGHITRGRGITIHTLNCTVRSKEEMERVVKVEWNQAKGHTHPVNIRVITQDRPGILSNISKTINNCGPNIRSAMAKSLPEQKGSFIFEIEVRDYTELLKVISSIESMEEVINVERI
jgi:guanosine-3',5'-bis(diphosphate) 3'-pyrophosphohydrolase